MKFVYYRGMKPIIYVASPYTKGDVRNEKDDYLYFLKRLVDLTVSLHQLIKEGVDESDEGEKIRDECDQYWDRISEEDKDWLRKLSASFYNLVENKGKNNA